MVGGRADFHEGAKAKARTRQKSGVNNGKLDGQVQPHQPPKQPSLRCPECGNKRLYRDGLRYLKDGNTIQRWLCRACGYRFSEPQVKVNVPSKTVKTSNPGKDNLEKRILNVDFPLKEVLDRLPLPLSENVTSHGKSITNTEKGLNTLSFYNSKRRVCETDGVLKNLVKVESRILKRAAGATAHSKKDTKTIKGKIVEFLWWMQKEGYAESTIVSRGSRLRRLLKLKADLLNPESVKEIIATQKNWSISRKEAMVWTYDLWAKWLGIEWEKPIYKPVRKLPFIPLEREIDDLIAGCNKYVATFLQVAKETGARAGEIFSLKWIDIDFENRTVNITPEKGSNPRIFKISNRLIAMLNTLPKEHEQIFKHYGKLNYLRRSFDRYRKRTAHKLGNPRILKITFHTLRHWKATIEYHKTKDILYVMRLLGHRNIKNTLLYTQLVKPNDNNEEFISKVARTINEARLLVDTGFEYVCEIEGAKLFRKRK